MSGGGGGDGDGESERRRKERTAAEPTVGNGFTLAERQDPEGMFQKAKATALEGRLPEAIALYREVVATYPAHVRARNNLGVLLDQTGSHEAALEHFYAAVGLEPENAELLTNFGAALAASGQYGEAEAQLRKAARIDPGGLDVRANLGILYFRRGLYAECEAELRWVCDHDKEHALAHFYRGEALNRLGKVDEALEMLERAVVLQPAKARIYYLLGILYDRKNLPREAAPMYRRARELTDP
jgi:Flp pilus assembly protein TadD